MGLMYFFPGRPTVSIGDCEELGLGRSLGGTPNKIITGASNVGPTGKRGFLCWNLQDASIHYDAQAQEWIECAGGKFWIGYARKKPPGPSDLIRPRPLDGYLLKLADGNHWQVPTARIPAEGDTNKFTSPLPQVIQLDPTGKRTLKHKPEYSTLLDYATTAWEMFTAAKADEGPMAEEEFKWNACVEALATNYMLSQWEISALGIIATDLQIIILGAMCDWYAYVTMLEARAEAKKNDAPASMEDGSDASDG